MAKNNSNKPVQKFEAWPVTASVWRNERQDKPGFSRTTIIQR